MAQHPHTVIVGGGFAGLHAAKVLGEAGAPVTLIDRRNFHLFQPLLYQVATGGLSPGDISSPIRAVLSGHAKTVVLQDEVVDIRPDDRVVVTRGDSVAFDRLIVTTGVRHHYFGHDSWASRAPGLKTIEDALDIRRRILLAFEAAEKEVDEERRQTLLNFVVVGGGPTGVELAGALCELSRATLRRDFRHFDPARARVIVMEGEGRVLPGYPDVLSQRALRSLEKLGARVELNTMVTGIDGDRVTFERDGEEGHLEARTILWAAGVRASRLGRLLCRRTGAECDRVGRVHVAPDLSVAGYPDIMVAGDLARCPGPGGEPLPGVAQVAIQQGRFAAHRVLGRAGGEAFRYRDRGSLAVIGRNAAVADLGRLRLSGFVAWLIWIFVHIAYLIEYDNRVIVMTQWAMNYVTRKRGARLITNEQPSPDEEEDDDGD